MSEAMAAVTTIPGIGFRPRPPAHPVAPRDATSRGRRTSPATYRRRRIAAVLLAVGVVVVAAQAGDALGGSTLATPERRPASSSSSGPTVTEVVVRPGDTLWAIAERLAPAEDPRPVVDAIIEARGPAPLEPGETILWPR